VQLFNAALQPQALARRLQAFVGRSRYAE